MPKMGDTDTEPFANNEHFALMNVGDSRTDLNIGDSNRKPSLFNKYNVNGRLFILAISILCFILALLLFISTVVIFYSRPVNQVCNLDSTSASVRSKLSAAVSDGTYDGINDRYKTTPNTSTIKNPDVTSGQTDGTDFLDKKWSVTKFNGKNVRPGALIYSEDFNDFNTSTWGHITEESGSHFFYWVNSRNNSYTHDGTLFLKPTYTADTHGEAYLENGTLFLGTFHNPEKCNASNPSNLCWKKDGSSILHPIMSAMVTTKDSMKFTYGRLVIRAKMPAGDWIEPIISLQPVGSVYGEDLLSGQVHLVDLRGNRKLFNPDRVNVGSEQNCPDIRYGHLNNRVVIHQCLQSDNDEGFDTKFHDYEILWTPESISIKVDGEGVVEGPNPRPSFYKLWSKGKHTQNPWNLASNSRMAPFDVDFYLVMGLSIGGTSGYFRDDFQGNYDKPWKNNDEKNAPKEFWDKRNLWEPSWKGENSALKIDSIKLYALETTTSD